MAFRFAARTLLELGKELISSDEVALYELIKNAVDAGSAKVEIVAQILLPHSVYARCLEYLAEGTDLSDILTTIQKGFVSTAPKDLCDRFFRTLERKLHNRDSFRRTLVALYARDNWIDVRDQGKGMTINDLDEVFLTVGTRSRRKDNIEGASFLGDKGVGRLSTMRLGDRLLVFSATADQPFWGRLRINWNRFSHDDETPLEEIKVEPVKGQPKASPAMQGTTIRISSLNADWTPGRFEDVIRLRIARTVDPFEAKGNGLMLVRHNGNRVVIPVVPRKLLEAAHASCAIKFFFDPKTDEPILEADLNYSLREKKSFVRWRGVEIFSMAQKDSKRRGKRGHAAFENILIRPQALKDLGPFEAEIYWFNRAVVRAIDGLTEKQQETRDQIAQWSGGPMLYRHGFRVLPYGEPGDDWLALDRNAFGESGFKLNRQQVLGRVLIHSSHLALSEQTNRQGLIESDAEAALRKMLMVTLHVELRGLINAADQLETIKKREAEESAMDFRRSQVEVETALDELRLHLTAEQIPYGNRLGDAVETLVAQCAAAVRKLDGSVAQTIDDREKFLHLAGIGLITEFIFHELDRAVRHTISALVHAQASQQQSALRALEDQLVTLQKRVSAFDELTGEKRQTKSSFDVADVIAYVLEQHENEFGRHAITIVKPQGKGFVVKAVRGMLVQILENLIANSTYWLKLQASYQSGFKPQIEVMIDPETKSVTVEDNGPGVDPSRKETIFQPFITSKPAGQGRGLGLYISRELAEYNGWQLYMDSTVGRQRDGRLNMFVIDMGDA
ncbi:sensor histidine kinase [Shinella zoogloeoides]|uniref:sensor histidine kinase n=1 Tax=Shinella zoogloeoides TaxID=352475 RepID=UPI0028A7A1EB|nr:sensor histidine kinase [Shinella zoogloeoides]